MYEIYRLYLLYMQFLKCIDVCLMYVMYDTYVMYVERRHCMFTQKLVRSLSKIPQLILRFKCLPSMCYSSRLGLYKCGSC